MINTRPSLGDGSTGCTSALIQRNVPGGHLLGGMATFGRVAPPCVSAWRMLEWVALNHSYDVSLFKARLWIISGHLRFQIGLYPHTQHTPTSKTVATLRANIRQSPTPAPRSALCDGWATLKLLEASKLWLTGSLARTPGALCCKPRTSGSPGMGIQRLQGNRSRRDRMTL
jgi:hypothetical protein